MSKRYKANLHVKNIEADLYEVSLHIDESFTFEVGQYIWLILPTLNKPDPKGNRRAFSITSAPNLQNNITFVFHDNKESEFKKYLKNMTTKEEVTVEGPFGAGLNLNSDTYLIGEGIGVAPFLSAIRDLSTFKEFNITLFSIHQNGHHLYEQELAEISSKYPNFKYIKTDAELDEALISELSKKSLHTNAKWYLSGSSKTIDSLSTVLLNNGVPYNSMHFEEHYPHIPGDFYLTVEQLASSTGLSYYKHITDQSTNHVIITDIDGIIIYANKAAERLTGFSFSEMQGHTPRLWGGLMPKDFYTEFWKVIKIDRLPFKGEITNRNKQGIQYTAIATVTPIFDKEKLVAFLGIEEDITTHSNVEREYQRKAVELERLNRLMVDRELKMIELKKEILLLKEKLSQASTASN